MALIAWWPLTGTLNDYSPNKYNLTNNGASISNDGKVGQCYTLNMNSQSLSINNTNLSNVFKPQKDFSISTWVYFTGSDAADNPICSIGSGSANTHLHIVRRNGVLYANHFSNDFNTGITLQNNIWYHITYTYDGKTRKQRIFVNDILKESTRTADLNVGSTVFYIGQYASFNSQARFNDFRIYNHVLSAREVKELSKAKILHYNFNNPYEEPTINKYANHPSPSGISTSEDGTLKQVITKLGNGHYRVRLEKKVDGNNWPNVQFPVYSFVAGNKYSISIDLKTNVKVNSASAELRHSAVGNDYGTDGRQAVMFTNDIGKGWKRYSLTRVINATHTINSTQQNASPRIEIYTNMHKAGDILEFEFKNYQVEEKDHSTPFTTGSRKGLITDMSGYKNHASITSSACPAWNSESPMASGSYRFNKVNTVINKAISPISSKQYTVSLWFKKFDNDFYQGIFQFNNNRAMRLMGFDGNKIRFHPIGLENASTFIEFGYNINQWYHVVMIVDDLKAILYVDNVNKGEINLSKNIPSLGCSEIVIGRDSIDPERTFNGLITDVKVYATALSTNDVSELYKLKGFTSKNGKLFVNELDEQIQKIQIINNIKALINTNQYKAIYSGNPTGQLDISDFVESNKTLGNTKMEGYVYISSTSYLPGMFEYTVENNSKGFQFVLPAPVGGWKKGWNFFSTDVTGYADHQNTNWTNMNRVELYHLGAIPATNTTEFIEFKNVCLVKRKDGQKITGPSVTRNSTLNSSEINEIGFPIRYIRDHLNGSNKNTSNHWCELMAVSNGVNVASGIIATGSTTVSNASNITDNIITSNPYGSCGSDSQYIQLDLGAVKHVDYIHVWHFYDDSRVYNDTKTEVSIDGQNWITIFDSAKSDTYTETSKGKKHYLSMDMLRMFNNGQTYANEFIEI